MTDVRQMLVDANPVGRGRRPRMPCEPPCSPRCAARRRPRRRALRPWRWPLPMILVGLVGAGGVATAGGWFISQQTRDQSAALTSGPRVRGATARRPTMGCRSRRPPSGSWRRPRRRRACGDDRLGPLPAVRWSRRDGGLDPAGDRAPRRLPVARLLGRLPARGPLRRRAGGGDDLAPSGQLAHGAGRSRASPSDRAACCAGSRRWRRPRDAGGVTE